MVTQFRQDFDRRITLEQRTLLTTKHELEDLLGLVLAEPTQIAVFDFVEPFPVGFLIVHNPNFRDLDFYVYERVANPQDLRKLFTQEKPFWLADFKQLGFFKELDREPIWSSSYTYHKERALLWFTEKEARKEPRFIVNALLNEIDNDVIRERIVEERRRIGESSQDLKLSASKIPEPGIRAKVLDATKTIDEALGRMKLLEKDYEKRFGSIEDEIGGVRRLIGATKEYQDFRVLTSAVDEIKKDHVNKPLFDETIRRVDERIDGLSTRIDDMQAIRFWSKRTILDMILGAVATISTIVAALLAAGILHF